MNPEGLVIRGAVEGAPLELRGVQRMPAVLPLKRPAAERQASFTTGLVSPESQASIEKSIQEARNAGYEEGRAQGEKDGYEAGLAKALEHAEREHHALQKDHEASQQKLADALARINHLAEAMFRERMRFLDDAEDDMVSLAFEAFCRVLSETALTRDMLKSGVVNALANWRGKTALEIHVHPEDLLWLEGDKDLSAQFLAQRNHAIRWVANAEVVLGGCMLHSTEGGLDARLDIQVDMLKVMLLETRATRRTERPA